MTQPTQPWGAWNTVPAVQAAITWDDTGNGGGTIHFDCVVDENWDEGAAVTEHPVEVGADVADHIRVQLRKCTLHVWSSNEPIDRNWVAQATVGGVTLDAPAAAWQAGPNTLTIPVWDNPIALRALGGALAGFAGQAIGGALGGAQTGQLAGDIAALVGLEAAYLALPASAEPQVVPTDAGLQPFGATSFTAQVQQWPGGTSGVDYVSAMVSALQLLKNTAQLIQVIGSKTACYAMVITGLTTVRSKDTGSGADITIEFSEVRLVTTQTVAAPIPNLSAGGGVPPQNKGKQDAGDAPPQTQTSVAFNFKAAFAALPPGGLAGVLGNLFPAGPVP